MREFHNMGEKTKTPVEKLSSRSSQKPAEVIGAHWEEPKKETESVPNQEGVSFGSWVSNGRFPTSTDQLKKYEKLWQGDRPVEELRAEVTSMREFHNMGEKTPWGAPNKPAFTDGLVSEATSAMTHYGFMTKDDNAIDADQILPVGSDGKRVFTVCRNGVGRGGTPNAVQGQAGTGNCAFTTVDVPSVEGSKFATDGGSMSYLHQFLIPSDRSWHRSNAAFFAATSENIEWLEDLHRAAVLWARQNGCEETACFFFHVFPNNSLMSLHLHCIDMARTTQKRPNGRYSRVELPGFAANKAKTVELKHVIAFLTSKCSSSKKEEVFRPLRGDGTSRHHLFFVIGAPTYETVTKFEDHHRMYGDQLRLVICASLEGYVKNRTHPTTQDVYKLPTNFRAHFSDFTQTIKQGKTVLHDDRSFIQAQTEVSNSLKLLIENANKYHVQTYFAIVDRKNRPTCITVSGEEVVATKSNQRDLSDLPTVDLELTNDVLDRIVLPSFQNSKGQVVSELQRLTGGLRKDGTPWTGSFLADVLTVACACCLDDFDSWTRYDVSTNEVLETGTFSKSSTLSNVPFWNVGFDRSDDGNIYSFNTSSLPKMTHHLQEFANDSTPPPIWKSCFVWHDAFLNDIDDLPAIELCKKLSVGHVDAQCNWNLVHS